MWICQRCQSQNLDSVQACPVCGAVRAGGRFGSPRQQRAGVSAAPRVTAAQVPQLQDPVPSANVRPGFQPPEENARASRAARGKSGRLARLVGGLLCVLLPAMTLLLSWQQRESLLPVLAPLFTGAEAPQWLQWTCYGALSLAAALISLLPGLWTLLLNRRK